MSVFIQLISSQCQVRHFLIFTRKEAKGVKHTLAKLKGDKAATSQLAEGNEFPIHKILELRRLLLEKLHRLGKAGRAADVYAEHPIGSREFLEIPDVSGVDGRAFDAFRRTQVFNTTCFVHAITSNMVNV